MGKDELFTGASTESLEGAEGNAGNITITSEKLSLTNDALLLGGEGQVLIEATDSVKISGADIVSDTGEYASGKAGSIAIETGSLELTNEANILTQTNTTKKASDIEVEAKELIAVSGIDSSISSQTGGLGNAGTITINTSEFSILDSAQISSNNFIIKTFEIDDEGKLIRNILEQPLEGSGKAGTIDITATNIALKDRGGVTTLSSAAEGGNIKLQANNLLSLRNNSEISASAGAESTSGNGGNITIDAPFIIAFPQENSDITANAFEGDGGNIRIINTNGIFGIEFRDQETSLSDITASSEFGQEGEVEINNSGVDPTRGLNNLPQEAVEAEFAQSCQETGSQSTLEFFDIGRGGLPPTPEDLFSSEIVIAEWIPLDLVEEKISVPTSEQHFSENGIKNITLQTAFLCQKKLIKG